MTRTFLTATVAALAIIAPTQSAAAAEQRPDREQKARESKRGEQRVERAKARPQADQRRQQSVRIERPRAPQQARQQRLRSEQPRLQARERIEIDRSQARQQVRIERQAAKIERRVRSRQRAVERVRPQRVERQRIERQARAKRVERNQRRGFERQAIIERNQRRAVERRVIDPRADRSLARQMKLQERRADRFERAQRKIERRDDRLQMKAQQRALARLVKRPNRILGDRVNLRQADRDWYDNYLAQRYSASYGPTSRYSYDYNDDDGYVYQVNRRNNLVTALLPVLGGAFGVAQPLPVGYNSYNVPSPYRSLYYDTPNSQFRYGDGAIYRVDPKTQLVQAVVALLTGQSLGVGQMLPAGYDVYNVPYDYRQRYFDSDDMWYRYSDGYIYGVDPYTRRIETMSPLSYGGYAVGYPVPSYANYGGYTGYGSYAGYPGYSVPYGYQNLYYSQPGYNYQYANRGIYQVDPTTQLVQALVALVSGANFGIGQLLPTGYDAYNVPSAYRATYYDTPDAWYRYDDGYIYQVDPRSRMIEASIPVSYDGYTVGAPVPAAYPGYAVPDRYSDLYYAAPGYDYRYFDGGIYAIDPNQQTVESQVALLTGQTFGVGQMLPMGYDAYNVPLAYRDRYFDSDRSLYRYADGYIYQVDPTTRLIQAVIDAIV